jgi:tripartite-type tricarboxylate transporter receptor subunit TctC
MIGRALGLALMLLAALPAAAAEPSFAGKQVTVLITVPPGGGTDSQARLIGRFLQRHLAGSPAFLFINMPGAAGIVATNHLVQRTKPDGLTLLAASGEGLDPLTLRNPSTHYDPRTLAMVGGTSTGGTIIVLRKSARARLTDAAADPVVFGSVSSRTSTIMALWGAEYLGWNLRWVLGYASTPSLTLAINQGEIDMTGTSTILQLKQLLGSGDFLGLAQAGSYRGGRLVAREDYPDIPLFPPDIESRLAGNEVTAREAFDYFLFSSAVGKWLALAPGTPQELVRAWRDAYRRTCEDADFLAAARAEIGEDFAPMPVEDLTLAAKRLAETSDAALAFEAGLKTKHGLANPAN